jgi:hypothetical protein
LKKWFWHRFFCVCNAVAVTGIVVLFAYELIITRYSFSFGDLLGMLIFLFSYFIYILSDLAGLKLYAHYKNLQLISFATKVKVEVLLFLLLLLQLFVGFGVVKTIARYLYESGFTGFGVMRAVSETLLIIAFLSSVFVFTGLILLMRAIKKNKNMINQEIESIGKSTP